MELRETALAGKLVHRGELATEIPADGWVLEPKWDGWRLIAEVTDDHVNFYSRSGHSYNGKLPHVEAELLTAVNGSGGRLFPADTWLDGEAVARRVDKQGRVVDDWRTVQSVLSKLGAHAAADRIKFVVFDLLAHRGIDARPLPFKSRRRLLEKMFSGPGFDAVELTAQLDPTQENHDRLVTLGFEGSMLKRLDAPYASGKKGHGLRKVKQVDTTDVVIMGFKPGKGGITGLVGAVIIGQYDGDGELVEQGSAAGFDMKTRRHMTEHPDEWLGKVIEVAFNGKVKDGRRHARMKRVRNDKTAEECVLA